MLYSTLFQFIKSLAFVGFAIILYPILRKSKESLALGFLSFRIMAAVLNTIGFICLLLLLSLSQEYIRGRATDLSYYQILGNLLRSGRDFVNHIAMILTVSVGNLMFYLLLFQTKLIPRWISLCGFIGTIFTITASLLIMFHIIDIITPIYIALNLPLILLEIVLAIWLIAKGLDSNVMDSKTEMIE